MKTDNQGILIESAAASLRRDLAVVERDAEEIHDEEIEGQMATFLDEVRTGVGAAILTLTASGRIEEAETLLAPLLDGITHGEDEPLPECLEALGTLRGRAANLALVRRLTRRPSDELVRDLRRLDPEVLGGPIEADFGGILARLWNESEEGAEGAGLREKAFESFGVLRRQGVAIDTDALVAEIADSLAPQIEGPVELERQQERVERVEELRDLGVLGAEHVADLLLNDAAGNLEAGPPIDAEDQIAELVGDEVARGFENAGRDSLKELEGTIGRSSWIENHPPTVELIRLRVAAALGRPESPVEVDGERGMVELARKYGTDFAGGLAIWLGAFAPRAVEAREALDPYLTGALRGELADGVAAYSEKIGPRGRFELVEKLLGEAFARTPSVRLLRQLGIADADEAAVCDRIIELYKSASRMEDRGMTLVIWEALDPQGAGCRRALIEEVFIPLARRGVGGYERARRRLELVRHPPVEVQSALLAALRDGPDRERRRDMDKRMKELGVGR
jgi:hypothetical protein